MRSASFNQSARTYTCIFCEHRSVHQRCFPRSSTFNRTTPTSRSTRWFSLTSAAPFQRKSQTSHAEQNEASDSPLTFSLKPGEVKTSQTSQIRESLRAWSRQNEQIKEERTVADLPYTGKIVRIPNSLFLEDGQKLGSIEADHEDDKRLPSNEEEQDYESSTGDYQYGHIMTPGTLLSYKSTIITRQNAIYLGDIGLQSLLLLSNGNWAADRISQKRAGVSRLRSVTVPNFLNNAEVEILRAHMPKRDVTRALEEGADSLVVDVVGTMPDDIVEPILRKMRDFKKAEQSFIRDNKAKLDQMYDELADENEWRIIPVKKLPNLVLGVDYEDMPGYARKAFVHHANHFHSMFMAAQAAATVTYYVAPKRMYEDTKVVQGWARLYQEAAAQAAVGKNVSEQLKKNPLSTFIDKARRIIVESRKIRTPTSMGMLSPAKSRKTSNLPEKIFHEETFTSDERKIIDYLWGFTMRRPISTFPVSHASLIVRAVGAYPSMDLGQESLRMLLQELGVVDPWGRKRYLNMPMMCREVSTEMDHLWQEANESIASTVRNHVVGLSDSMASMRKDWGSMEAIAVDVTHAHNIEDAISVEPASEFEGGYWIHVHTAHPTSHLSADHPVSKLARKLGVTNYALTDTMKVIQMVPRDVLHQFVLQPKRPVLTISTLVSMDGHVHDIKVTPAIIQNLVRLDRRVVDKLMNDGEDEEDAVLVVGKVPRETVMSDDVQSPDQFGSKTEKEMGFLPKLNLLRELLLARIDRRKHEIDTPAPAKKIKLLFHTRVFLPEEARDGRERESYHWNADPGIVIRGRRRNDMRPELHDDRRIDPTTEAMRLAAESFGRWLQDRNIPAVYLGNEIQAGVSTKDIYGNQDHPEYVKYPLVRSSLPRPFLSRNTKQHASCTSPLRRYIDMISHFQADYYLKAVAAGQLQADAPVHDESILAFSKAEIDQYLEEDVAVCDTIDQFEGDGRNLWALHALFRAFHFKEAALPEKFEVIVRSPARRNSSGKIDPASGSLVPWTVQVELLPSPEGYENMAKVDEFIPVKLLKVDPPRRLVHVRAIGPPTAQQQDLDQIHCYTPDNFITATPIEARVA